MADLEDSFIDILDINSLAQGFMQFLIPERRIGPLLLTVAQKFEED